MRSDTVKKGVDKAPHRSLIRATGKLHSEADMEKPFILDKILGHEVLRSGPAVAWGLGLGFFIPLTGIAIGWGIARLVGLEHGTGKRTFALSAGIQNFGFG